MAYFKSQYNQFFILNIDNNPVISYSIPPLATSIGLQHFSSASGIIQYIFKIGDLKSLKECILKLEKADLKTMSTWIIQHFNEHEYSMEQHIEKLVLCYNTILNS